MKVGRFKDSKEGVERLGVITEKAGTSMVLDVGAAFQARHGDTPFPNTMDGLIAAARRGLDAVYELQEWALREGETRWMMEESSVPWMVPVKVRNCIAGGRNFSGHRAEAAAGWSKRGVSLPPLEIPVAFIKLASIMVPTRCAVQKPAETDTLDYEVEGAAVIGWPALAVSEKDALKSVFGYTVMNDLSARDIQYKEMGNQTIVMGKNFPGFGPVGPWILTADELPDPGLLELELRVNGDVRQQIDCRNMTFSFAEMVSYWSRMGLDRGDLLTTSSPPGVASARPEPEKYYLKPGDVVHAGSRQIGTLETRII